MKFKKVLLLNPAYEKKTYAPYIFAGLGYIAEALKQNKIRYDVIDMNLGYSLDDVLKNIHQYKPDLVGLQVMSLRYNSIYKIIRKIKHAFPNIKIVVGGGHISLFRNKVLEECSQIDYGIVLEGEETIVELCQGMDVNKIKGLLYRQDNDILYNGNREFTADLDKIPFPTYYKFELKKYPEILLHIVSSRGCPYMCGFCPVEQSIGRKFRVRSPKNVVDELEYWYKKGITHFGFVDDNFTFYKQRVLDICDEIEKRNLKNLRMFCGNGVRADKVDYEILKRMKSVGFYNICIGVESANNKVLKELNKYETVEQIEKAIKIACDLKYTVGLFFIIGYPSETLADLQNSFNLALKYPIGYANFYNLMPFPKTKLYDYLSEKNLLLSPYNIYLNNSSHFENVPCFETPEMSYKQRIKAFKMAKKVSNQVIINRICRQYSYLGIFAKVIGHIFVLDFIQKSFLSNPLLKKVLNKLK